MKYNTYFENLIRGRQQEFLVYREVYRISEQLFGKVKLNIYDQITDIDGIDFLIRCESNIRTLYLEAQVKKATGVLSYDSEKGSLKQLVDKALKTNTSLIVFVVDYVFSEPKPTDIYFYQSTELHNWHTKTGRKSFNLKNLNSSIDIDRNVSISTFGQFLLKELNVT